MPDDRPEAVASQPEAVANRIILADNLEILRGLPADSVHLIYIDPPFNTGRTQARTALTVARDEEKGDRTGFGGRRIVDWLTGEQLPRIC